MNEYDKNFFMQYLLAEGAVLKREVEVLRHKLNSSPMDEAIIFEYLQAVIRNTRFEDFERKLCNMLKFLP